MRFSHAVATCALALAAPGHANAEQLISDTLVVSGSLCAGAACAAGETFENGTIKFRQNAVRVHFDDASAIAQTDWQIEINDGSQTGPSYFALNDLTAGTTPFRIDAGAPTGSLAISQYGYVGIGTTLPDSTLHLAGPVVRVRIEDTAPGGPSQIWDLIANEGTLFLANNTLATTPLIAHSSAENALLVLTEDRVGLGTETPQSRLHVYADPSSTTYDTGLTVTTLATPAGLDPYLVQVTGDTGSAAIGVTELNATANPRTLLNLQNNGRPEIVMGNTATNGEWSFGAGTDFFLKTGTVGSTSGAKTKVFTVKQNGDAIVFGTLTTGGTTCGGGCDRVFTDHQIIPATEYASQMWSQGHLPHVGPTPEGAPLNVSEKLGGMLNALEHAHVFIDAQNARIASLEADKAAQDARIARLEARLAALTGEN